MSKVMLVTGGSRGIGAAVARQAAAQGYSVALTYLHNAEQAKTVVEGINSQGGNAISLQADVADEQQVINLFEQVDKRLGKLCALVNNAGILEQQMRVETMDAARLNRILTTNVTGSFICCREAIKRMSTAKGGNGGGIVNLSSRAAKLGSANEYVDYAASKAAVDTLTQGLANEVAAEGIRVNAVAPGAIHTDIHASGGEPGRVERIKAGIPMQRGGYPDEVANAVLWLLSDQASYTTGSIVDVSGGR